MNMDSTNSNVLKLVHPGRFVEIHKQPITAAEVMKKNPRHCVTRPDVFKFPWIVVRPESVLKPGSVFFIVPYHTIHSLLQASQNQTSLLEKDFHSRYNKYTCPIESWVEHEFKHTSNEQFDCEERDSIISLSEERLHRLLKRQCPNISQTRAKVDCKCEAWHEVSLFPNCLVGKNNHRVDSSCHDKLSFIKSHFELRTRQHCDDSPKKLYSVKHWQASFRYENGQKSKQQYPVNSLVKPRPLLPLDIASGDAQVGGASREDDGGLRLSTFLMENRLKPCLKKNNQARAPGFRVKFALPGEDGKKLKSRSP